MAQFDTMKTGIALRCHDASKAEITDANYGVLLNQAVDDLAMESIVLPLAEDESITLGANDWQYDVPASFAYIREIRQETAAGTDKYPNVLKPGLWRLTIDSGSTPVIQFDENEFSPTAGLDLKVIGQKRVPQYTGTDTIAPALAAFIRERAVAYAADTLAGGVSELSQWRRALATECWARSLDMLRRIPREYRPLPDARRVPER